MQVVVWTFNLLYYKAVGDAVSEDEVVGEVETDKVSYFAVYLCIKSLSPKFWFAFTPSQAQLITHIHIHTYT